nr:hypothetical protein [Bacteroidota bacterium]
MLNKEQIQKYLKISEPVYFYLVVIVNTIPVLAFKYFPTVDGPAHLYNATLMLEMLKGDSPINDFLVFNRLTPNWLGHLLLMCFNYLFSATISEKIFLLIYLVGFPLVFRQLIKTVNSNSTGFAYFVFPFTYSFLFLYGLYNFFLGMVIFFWALSLWVKYSDNFTLRRSMVMFFLLTLLCLSHVFMFSIFVFVVGMIEIKTILRLFDAASRNNPRFFRELLYKALSFSSGAFIAIKFLVNVTEYNEAPTYIPSRVLLSWLRWVQPAKAIGYIKEDAFTPWILYSFLLVGVYIFVRGIRLFARNNRWKVISGFIVERQNIWFFISAILLIALFIVPDYKGEGAGIFSSRILLLFFLFSIVWLSTRKTPFWLNIIVFIMINYASLSMLTFYYQSVKGNNQIIKGVEEASTYIDKYSTVLPVRLNNTWLYGHVSNYLGYNKPIVILENYEASHKYFPLIWNRQQIPNLKPGDASLPKECIFWENNEQNHSEVIDYVFVFGKHSNAPFSECNSFILRSLENKYTLLFTSTDKNVRLYVYKGIKKNRHVKSSGTGH